MHTEENFVGWECGKHKKQYSAGQKCPDCVYEKTMGTNTKDETLRNQMGLYCTEHGTRYIPPQHCGLCTVEHASARRLFARAQADVARFDRAVIGLPLPDRPTTLGADRRRWAVLAFTEEVREFVDATKAGDVVEAADALVDLVYFALGRLEEMGVPFGPVWDAVQEANMGKVRGEWTKRPGSLGHDAVKPEGWEPPDHSWLREVTTEDLRVAVVLRKAKSHVRIVDDDDDGADKHDDGKLPLSLIPREALELEAEVFGYGERKYAAWNWTKGMSYRRLIDAAMRHLVAFADGEDDDPESGLGHLGHLRACAAMLIGQTRIHPELDDRRKP